MSDQLPLHSLLNGPILHGIITATGGFLLLMTRLRVRAEAAIGGEPRPERFVDTMSAVALLGRVPPAAL